MQQEWELTINLRVNYTFIMITQIHKCKLQIILLEQQ